MISKTDIIVRYAETDQMGIVHHSVYAVWFEAARTEFIKETGISYSECEKRGLMLPLVFLECSFKKPAFYEDIVSVEVSIEKMTPVRMTMRYRVTNKATGEELAEGRTGHVWTNTNRQPVNIKKHNPEIYEIINKCI
ncbi:MAG: acyl-CoA thioesterase [Clostridia bacterium]|nr:acyl-CoA thioesterase [Clostridia bacterium]